MFDLLINNGTIITHEEIFKGSIAVENGKIAGILSGSKEVEAEKVIDAEGKMVFPGGIDVHAHLNDPGFEWREDYIHGSKSAAAGGITTFVDMPLQNDPALTTPELFDRKDEIMKDRSVVDFAFWGGLVDNNVDQLEGLNEKGAAGFKAFLGPVSPDYSTVFSGVVRDALKITSKLDSDKLVGFHAEDYAIVTYEAEKAQSENRNSIRDYLDSRPPVSEVLAVENVIRLAKEFDARVHIVHVSHPDVAEKIKKAQQEGVKITAETCGHYLVFNEEDFVENGPLFKCAPPLRTEEAKNKLWDYVIDGTLSCVASDHSPCTLSEKEEGSDNIWKAWGGISGLQSTFQVFYDAAVNKRNLSPKLVAKSLAYGPSKAFDLQPKKGLLKVGADADIVILDPEKSWEITSDSLYYKNQISAFVGLTGKGAIEKTIVRGNVVYDDQITVEPGYGNLIKL